MAEQAATTLEVAEAIRAGIETRPPREVNRLLLNAGVRVWCEDCEVVQVALLSPW